MKKLMAILAAAAIFSLAGCTPKTEDTAVQQSEGTAVIGLADSISGEYLFTDAWGSHGTDTEIRSLIFGGGTVARAKDGTLVSDSSTLQSVTIREEKNGDRTYIFTLNSDLYYCDGSPITARDYVFSVLLQSSREFAQLDGADNTLYDHLVGWEAFSSGQSSTFEGVKLLSDTQFSLTISRNVLPCYDELTMVQVYPLPVSVLAPDCKISGSEWSGVTSAALRKTILGSNGYRYQPTVTAGPYALTEISGSGDDFTLTLTANSYYNGGINNVSPYIATLKIGKADLDSPEKYDLICGISGKDTLFAAKAVAENNMTDYSYTGNEMSAILFGESIPVNVRQALAALLDPEACVELLAGRWGEPVVGMNSLSTELTEIYHAELVRLNAVWNDPDLAEKLLIGSEPELTFTYDQDDERGADMAALLQQISEDTSLLTVTAEPVSSSELTEMRLDGDYDLLFFNDDLPTDAMPWDGPEIFPESMQDNLDSLMHTSGGLDYRYEEKWLAFQKLYQQELPALGLCGYEQCDLTGPRLINYQDPSAAENWTTLILSAWIEEE